jgi:DNA polymerase
MESNNNIDKKKLNESLNTLLNLFDESEGVLKGDVLPSNPIQKTNYNFEDLVENIANGTLNTEKTNQENQNNLTSSIDEEREMAGLPLSQRLKAKLNRAKSQNDGSTSNNENQSNLNNNRLPQNDSLVSRLASTQQQRIDNQRAQNDINNSQNNFDVSNASYNDLQNYVMNCTHCPECNNRLHVLFGEGKLPSRLMVIGEGPGRSENATGRLFVGPSGDFLSKWLSSIHLNMREDVYLSNIVKCWSGTNPLPQSANYCKRYLERQIEFVKPEAILILGKVAANSLLNNQLPLNQMRNVDLKYNNIPVVVTYHPAAVLRNEQWKRPVWNDLKRIASMLNINLNRR